MKLLTAPCMVASLTVLSFFPGCSKEQKGGPREETFPITGVVQVDGQPQPQIQVLCHSVGESKLPMNSAAYTNAEGEFAIGTYESGDGAPAGEYKLTFVWGQINLISGRYEPKPDRLNGRYSDKSKTEFTATVTNGEPCDLGIIALTTK